MTEFTPSKAKKVGMFILGVILGGIGLLLTVGGFAILLPGFEEVSAKQGTGVAWLSVAFLSGLGILSLFILIGIPLQTARFKVVTDDTGLTVKGRLIPWKNIEEVTEYVISKGSIKSYYLIVQHKQGKTKIPGFLQGYQDLKREITNETDLEI